MTFRVNVRLDHHFFADAVKLRNQRVSAEKALKSLQPGDRLEVHCTDPLSVIDIPNLIRETGDKVEITERAAHGIVFMIEKTNRLIEKAND